MTTHNPSVLAPEGRLRLNAWRDELSVKAKNGVDFITAGTLIWLLIALIWMRDVPALQKSIHTFYVGACMFPLAFGLSYLFKTTWKLPENPLASLGLWLNVAQLFYFPVLFFVMGKWPDYFVMTYAVITGAHFFPYSWFYRTPWYAVAAGNTTIGLFVLAINIPVTYMFLVPLTMSVLLGILSALLYTDWRKRRLTWQPSIK